MNGWILNRLREILGEFNRLIKHLIEEWAGRYVSQSDVEAAAELRPKIRGKYPRFNISRHLVLPSNVRLANIQLAKTQNYELCAED